ncbi:MAG: phosphate-starvation-inducible PsiE family protein [Lachnospiraceae bacterium]|nr:phosphate-starvation-inducible PsiE family protein [Lachnospiraceae bacterium]
MKKKPIHKKMNELIFAAAQASELLMSCIIMAVIIVLIAGLILQLPKMDLFNMDTSQFSSFLASALSLVVGVEFVKMLCKHTPETVIEVLLFATARQMVVEHMSPPMTLIGIIAIAILFAIRKFLFLKTAEKDTLNLTQ